MKFLRWREFHCLAAPRSYFKCLVEWLHRREIASAGVIAHTNELVQSIVFRSFDRIFAIETNEFRKRFGIMQLQSVWILIRESMTASRCETEQLYVAKQGWRMTPRFQKLEIFKW